MNRMQRIRSAILAAGAAAMLLPAATRAEEVPEQFESVAVTSADAYAFARGCLPTLSESSFERLAKSATGKATVTLRPTDPGKPYLAGHDGQVYCIRMSEKKYPMLPLAAFEETIDFDGMGAETRRSLRADLSRQLAARGYATALVVNAAGNANELVYLFAGKAPTRFYYHSNFLRKGEFAEGAHTPVYRTESGGMTLVSRGSQSENVKSFFDKPVGEAARRLLPPLRLPSPAKPKVEPAPI
jgi:hypothetical protein